MRKKINLLSLFILPLAFAGALLMSPTTGGQESQRGECEQACNVTFKECSKAPNANRATCSAQYKECRNRCKDVAPHPSPTPEGTPTTTPTP